LSSTVRSPTSRDDRRLVKLVRDDVEKFCGGDMMVRYEPMTEAEFVEELRKKLIEEAAEYLVDPCPEELADVLEVVQMLAVMEFGSLDVVNRAALRKRAHKGSFLDRLGMYLHVAPEHR
jgi:predicted house-cleaning noncanonical NTP pyrophosphatase (MazG superfamily)